MKRKLGAITIGQSPRVDVIPEMAAFLGNNVEVIEAGALDGLTYEEILEFKPEEDDYVLVSKLKDGRSVKFAEKYILPRLQECIDRLEREGADVILFICTGVFPDIFRSQKPILYPQKILHGITPQLVYKGKLAVITPDKDQVRQSHEKWSQTGAEVIVVPASPYTKEDELSGAILELRDKDIDIIAMDCIGYNQSMKKRVSEGTGKPVVLARTIVARVLGEILNA
ncbi:AroM family protein [Geosporobacter ferrireducens]|uniref:AroM family protein n=1 Tax=Geosporobacter ferrireducens TaxID=1424294 RepID=A0A1D8GM23_9FIRM|nr:AroM family protein [Geosporobacter ferrireducens]AOT71966.1 AroM family protein [Geosporobacter ferrireducens]MTI55833.1 AroM family protein [Geosporobacter ferrireducens]